MQIKQRTVLLGVALSIVSIAVGFAYLQRPSGTLPAAPIRQLSDRELHHLSNRALQGDCEAAYQVGLHHQYFSLNDPLGVKFFRLAARCNNPHAYAGLIVILASRPSHDREVDDALAKLIKLDPKMGERAELEVALRRQERSAK